MQPQQLLTPTAMKHWLLALRESAGRAGFPVSQLVQHLQATTYGPIAVAEWEKLRKMTQPRELRLAFEEPPHLMSDQQVMRSYELREFFFMRILGAVKEMTTLSPNPGHALLSIIGVEQGENEDLQHYFGRFVNKLGVDSFSQAVADPARASFARGIRDGRIRKKVLDWDASQGQLGLSPSIQDVLREAVAEKHRLESAGLLDDSSEHPSKDGRPEGSRIRSGNPRGRQEPNWSSRGNTSLLAWSEVAGEDAEKIKIHRDLCRRCGHSWKPGHRCDDSVPHDLKAAELARLCGELDRVERAKKRSVYRDRDQNKDANENDGARDKPQLKTQEELLAELRERRRKRSNTSHMVIFDHLDKAQARIPQAIQKKIDQMPKFSDAVKLIQALTTSSPNKRKGLNRNQIRRIARIENR